MSAPHRCRHDAGRAQQRWTGGKSPRMDRFVAPSAIPWSVPKTLRALAKLTDEIIRLRALALGFGIGLWHWALVLGPGFGPWLWAISLCAKLAQQLGSCAGRLFGSILAALFSHCLAEIGP